jgi:hypothetical protein
MNSPWSPVWRDVVSRPALKTAGNSNLKRNLNMLIEVCGILRFPLTPRFHLIPKNPIKNIDMFRLL